MNIRTQNVRCSIVGYRVRADGSFDLLLQPIGFKDTYWKTNKELHLPKLKKPRIRAKAA